SVTRTYIKHRHYHSIGLPELKGPKCAIEGANVHLHRKRKSSKSLNKLKGPAIILSASGMLTGGRILHHLINRLPDPRTRLVLVGFMAEGTLGRRIAEGAKTVYIHKQPVEVRADVASLHGLSGHADWYELIHWLEPIKKAPRRVFVTHGEQSQTDSMASHLQDEYGWQCVAPDLDQTFEL
ncbi:MAG: MBL fold metallo-hydrolase, partial [Candidatus Zixiibacteriota bacterium]